MTPDELLLAVLAFFSGAVPYAVLVGRYGFRKDIRQYGDGNPGAFNVIRAGGVLWGALAIFLDVGKAALPVGLAAWIFDITGWPLVLIAVAPPFGHAFSPFLRFRGGKAIAAIGGTWIGLSLVEVPLVGAVMLVFWYLTLTSSGWAVMFTMGSILIYLLLTAAPGTWLAVWFILLLLLVYRHRGELVHLPAFKPPPLFRNR